MFNIISTIDDENNVVVLDTKDGVFEKVSMSDVDKLRKQGYRFKTNLYLNFLVDLYIDLCKKQMFNDHNIYTDMMTALRKYAYGNTKFTFPCSHLMALHLKYEVMGEFFIIQLEDRHEYVMYYYAITPFSISYLFSHTYVTDSKYYLPVMIETDFGYTFKKSHSSFVLSYYLYHYDKKLRRLYDTEITNKPLEGIKRLSNNEVVYE